MVEQSDAKITVVGNPKIRVALPWGIWCPGCTYGHVVRLLCEVFEEMGIDDRAVGLTGIGCATGAFNLFVDVDFGTTPHGRAPAVATAIKRLHPDAIVFTVQGDALYRGE
jgi:2-oxoglutarate ferredoxin oxidoreductase subunit beta